MPNDYSTKSLDIQTRFQTFGFTPQHLGLIGAFVVAYGLFETTLERALWTLNEESVTGVQPFTEKMDSKRQFKFLAAGNVKLSAKCNAVLKVAAYAAEDLNDYRNSLLHGYLISFGDKSTPSFVKNPGWNHTKRKKAVGDAYIDEPFQDLVLIAAWTLLGLMLQVEKSLEDTDAQLAIDAMESDVQRARSYASEARHLRSLMNSEKY